MRRERKGDSQIFMDEYVIKTENLSKVYGSFFWKKKEPALMDLNLAIPAGTVFGFLGPNGAGKTTTIRLLMDLIRPTQGQATVLGRPVNDIEIKTQIGFLPDSPAFSSYLSAYEFLNICAKLLRLPSSVRKKRIYEVLEIVKMTEHAKSKLGNFSRGMIQRIGIAQAILNNPRLLILDEPLVGLDPLGRQELKNIIFRQREEGTNVFFCSHILSDVETICDHIGILHKGKLLCYGKMEELLSEKGVVLVIKPGHDEIIKDLMPLASSSVKKNDGTLEMTFEGDENVAKARKSQKDYGNAVSGKSSRESLEDFFFKTIDKNQKKS